MAVFDMFHRRQKALRGEYPDVYQYTDLPRPFRVQVVFILRDVFWLEKAPEAAEHWFKQIHDFVAREIGVFALSKRSGFTESVFEFIGTQANTEVVLSTIETAFVIAQAAESSRYVRIGERGTSVHDAVEELNARFQEHGIGYQLEAGAIIRVDSQALHQQVVKPVLHLLRATRFAGANSEFLKAHEHYRNQRNQEAMNECLKALESTLKVICKGRKWAYKDTDTAKPLLDVVFTHGLIPGYLEGKFTALRQVLESGVPTTRNRESGHGAGSAPKQVPKHLAGYVLHLTASSILFLAESDTGGVLPSGLTNKRRRSYPAVHEDLPRFV